MFKWLLRSGMFLQTSIFLIFAVILWLPQLVHPVAPVMSASDGPVYLWLVGLMGNDNTLAAVVALVLVIFESLLIFYIFHVHQYFGRSNFFPAIVALIGFSWNPQYCTLHALLPAMLFVLLALHALLMMYGKNPLLKNVFTASFSIGIASLIYTPLISLLLLVWFTLISYRISSWREYAVSIIGIVVPYIYYVSGLFWNDNLLFGWHQWLASVWPAAELTRLPGYFTAWLAVSAFVMVITLFVALNAMADRLISMRRRSWVQFNLLVAALAVLLLSHWQFVAVNYIFILPMAFSICSCLFLLKKPFRFEIMTLVYLLVFIAFRLIILVV